MIGPIGTLKCPRKLALAGFVIAAFLTLAADASAEKPRVLVQRESGIDKKLYYMPRSFNLGSGGTFIISGIRWQAYNGPIAYGTGTIRRSDCDPNCQAGRVATAPVKVRLRRRVRCDEFGVHSLIYNRLQWTIAASADPVFRRRRGAESLVPYR